MPHLLCSLFQKSSPFGSSLSELSVFFWILPLNFLTIWKLFVIEIYYTILRLLFSFCVSSRIFWYFWGLGLCSHINWLLKNMSDFIKQTCIYIRYIIYLYINVFIYYIHIWYILYIYSVALKWILLNLMYPLKQFWSFYFLPAL